MGAGCRCCSGAYWCCILVSTGQGSGDVVSHLCPLFQRGRADWKRKSATNSMISALAISCNSTSAHTQRAAPAASRLGSTAPCHGCCPPTYPQEAAPAQLGLREGPWGFVCELCPMGLVLAWSAVPRLSGKCCRPVAWLVSSLGLHTLNVLMA